MLRKTIPIILLGALALALAACAPPATTTPSPTLAPAVPPTKAAEPTKPPAPTPTIPPAATPTPKPAALKVGNFRGAGSIAEFIAEEKGYFKEQGLSVELVLPGTAADALTMLATGQVDALTSYVIGPAIFASLDRGIDIKLVAGMGQSRPNWEWIWVALRKDLADSGQVKKPSDLKGMKVAFQGLGTNAQELILRTLHNGGLKEEDVETVILQNPDMPAAFANKAIAAAYSFEPFISRLVELNLAVRWLPASSFYGGLAQAGLMFYGPTLIKDQDLGRRYMIAYLKGVRDYLKAMATKEGQQQMVDILIKYTAVKDPKLYEGIAWPYLDPNGSAELKSLGDQYKFMTDMSLYKGTKTLENLIDLSYAEYASQKLGKQ